MKTTSKAPQEHQVRINGIILIVISLSIDFFGTMIVWWLL